MGLDWEKISRQTSNYAMLSQLLIRTGMKNKAEGKR